MTIDPLERYHRRPARDKTLDLRKRCASPWCEGAWERLPGRLYCGSCHERLVLRGEFWRAKKASAV